MLRWVANFPHIGLTFTRADRCRLDAIRGADGDDDTPNSVANKEVLAVVCDAAAAAMGVEKICKTELTKRSKAVGKSGRPAALELVSSPTAPAFKSDKILIAAKLAGVAVTHTVAKSEAAVAALAPCAKTCVLQSKEGPVARSTAALRYVAQLSPVAELAGSTCFDEGLCDQWLEFGTHELEVAVVAVAAHASNKALAARAKKDAAAALAALDGALKKATFLAGDRVSVADCALVCLVHAAVDAKLVDVPTLAAKHKSVLRWYATCLHVPAFASVLPKAKASLAAVLPKKAAKAPAPAPAKKKSAGPAKAVDPASMYPASFSRGGVRLKELLAKGEAAIGTSVTVMGWVRSVREAEKGATAFVELNDGSCLASIQVVCGKDSTKNFGDIKGCGGAGSAFSFDGEVVASMGKGQTIEVRARSDCEGAGEQFAVTTLLPSDEKAKASSIPTNKDGSVDYSQDFFGKKTGLTVSGQLNVETHAVSLADCYTFGPTFRAENSHTSRHLAEFWMIEPEVSFAELKDDIALAEDYLKYCVAAALCRCDDDLQFFEDSKTEVGLRDRLKALVATPFTRLEYTEAIAILQKHMKDGSAKFENTNVTWGIDLDSEHERFLTEHIYKGPVVLINYPKDIKAFYMKLNPDKKTVAAMDILVPKIGEIIGGSQREDDLDVLEARCKEVGIDPEHLKWYCELRQYGSVPHAGFGLGFERLVMLVTGVDNIRDVIPFPRYPGHCNF
ncbi:asparagine-tRNA ligase [Aureococcus anophagefferens]|nr:asparagine-tRNA ligase [Aureococcus anophagefferens]